MATSSEPGSAQAETARAEGAAGRRDRAPATERPTHADAIADGGEGAPTRNTPRSTPRYTAPATPRSAERDSSAEDESSVPISNRERAVLELVTRLRLVPLALIHQTLFPDVSRQVAGRLIGRMVHRGWLQTWAEPTVSGGTPRWLFPTRGGQRAGLEMSLASAETSGLEQLVRTMAPSVRTRPLSLVPRLVPPFLRHQRELSTLLLSLAQANGALWYSAWDRPLPDGTAPIALPQPDGVLVLPGETGPELVFLEHDRAMESPAHFARAKAERYAELAVRPELCQRLFGFPTFRLAVTVEDARTHRFPLERLTRLARLLLSAGVARESLLTLAGWAATWPAESVWCRADDPFVPARLRPVDQDSGLRHTLLCAAATPGTPCACRARESLRGSP